MNAEPTPSELAPGQAALQAFLAARRSLAREGPADIAPWEIGAYLTDILDRALSALGADHPRVSVVAVGGFGRGELCLHSDIDVLLLHPEPVPEESIRAILYPLWDAGLRVGHATRTVRSTLAFARDDLSTLCSLLSARLLVGPAEPFTDLITGLGKLLAGARSGLPEQLAAQEQAVWAREPFALQELDLKLGRGGLRTLHRLDWDRRRSELLGEAPHVAEQPAEQEARRTLLAARQALHAVQGRASDRFVIELRSAVANWLGRDPIELATEVYRAARRVDGIASVRWGRVRATGTDPIAHAGLTVARFVRSRWTRGEAAATPLTLARSAAASGQGGHLSRWEWELAEGASRPEWTAGNRAGLLSLLAAGRTGWDALLGLWESGWLPRALPELGHVAGLAQAAPFHRHPTDAHLGATVANVVELADSAIGWCGEIAEQIGGLDELLLSAFLHDIGKGLEGDHSQVGADLAVSLLTRTGFGVATAGLVGRAVLHHLLLPETAFRRDIDDPEVPAGVARIIGDQDLLRVLALLSVADAKATGPDMWNPWKETLLRNLVGKVTTLLEGTVSDLPAELMKSLVNKAAGISPAEIDSHLQAMPPGYLARFGPDLVAHHLRLASPPPVDSEVRTTVLPGAPVSTLVTASRDRPGLLATIAGGLALHNLTVLEARIVTRADGVALDTFRVQDALGSDMIGQGRWPAIRETLERATGGEIDLRARLAEKRAAYPVGGESRPVTVVVYRSSNGLVVELEAGDRIGLLHDLGAAMADLGLEVDLAKIDTRGGQALDVFQVRNPRQHSEADITTSLRKAAS